MMTDSIALRLVCTVLFLYAGVYCGDRLLGGHSVRSRIDHGFHLAMCVAMVAMAWPVGLAIPLLPQGVLFAVAAVWFALDAARGTTIRAYYAVMIGTMVWMVAVMAGWLPGAAAHDHSGTTDSRGGGRALHDMAGMDMSSRSAAASSSPGWIGLTSLMLTLLFAAAAVMWLYKLLQLPGPAVSLESRCRPALRRRARLGIERGAARPRRCCAGYPVGPPGPQDRRTEIRQDRVADSNNDGELTTYNAMLAQLARTRK